MLKYLMPLLLSFTWTESFCQQTTLAKFIITDATINNVDATETYIDAGGYIAFYRTGEGNLNMTNIMSKRNTQSYGRMYTTQHKKLNETYETYKQKKYCRYIGRNFLYR